MYSAPLVYLFDELSEATHLTLCHKEAVCTEILKPTVCFTEKQSTPKAACWSVDLGGVLVNQSKNNHRALFVQPTNQTSFSKTAYVQLQPQSIPGFYVRINGNNRISYAVVFFTLLC